MSIGAFISHENILKQLQQQRDKIHGYYLADETYCVNQLLAKVEDIQLAESEIDETARNLVAHVRESKNIQGTVEAFIHEYSLSSEEGVVLMCLAEALLRIPDAATADRLIRDKIVPAAWASHIGSSHSILVNASTWGLMLTGKIVSVESSMLSVSGLVSRVGEPVVRTFLRQAMKMMGAQYVMGTTIELALKRSATDCHENCRFSFDMLGESALSAGDAGDYFDAYRHAILVIGKENKGDGDEKKRSISIKLSALHPRYEVWQELRAMNELVPQVLSLTKLAKEHCVPLTLDAEESERLDLSLDIFQRVKLDEEIKAWDGFGLAVQAYQKRAYAVLVYVKMLASACKSKIPVRLVKGAYWDMEIKHAQEQGLSSYPVFTRKASTDVSYLACAKYLKENLAFFFPQFATHNAHSLAAILSMNNHADKGYEFQRLHGMGECLYSSVIDKYPCRIYAPVGSYEDLLPYLVRRLLENGANSSFVNRIEDDKISIEQIIQSPIEKLSSYHSIVNKHIPLPVNLYSPDRRNSKGPNLSDRIECEKILEGIISYRDYSWKTKGLDSNSVDVVNPANRDHIVGELHVADEMATKQILLSAISGKSKWRSSSVEFRINCIEKFSSLLMKNSNEFYALMMFEAGKTMLDSVSEWREALDFCYYYSAQAKLLFMDENVLLGPVGEKNTYYLQGRGIFVCISPWNFPLAIFVGQVIAALLSGNVVIAKPSLKTALIASRVIDLLHQSGIPQEAIFYLPCSGKVLSQVVLSDAQIDGVAFTGSLETALDIHGALSRRRSSIVPLIAETGGLNAMIVDSSALPEQVVKDVLMSAFNSAGQRCSALRVLIIQQEVYEQILALLIEALKERVIGDPLNFTTDIPPVIDEQAKKSLNQYKEELKHNGQLVFELTLVDELEDIGSYVSPAIAKISTLSELGKEQFGPVLHVMSFDSHQLPEVLDDINGLNYGLTLGIHSRVDETIDYISKNAKVGNVYVNRNMVGAVVGVQPFGGEGLSGTGPKAGGPNYMPRFCTEKTISTNTAAIGGNASLLSLDDD